MTSSKVQDAGSRIYGFNVYKNGQLSRELLVPAGNALIAEIRAPRLLNDDEYLWYVVPRLVSTPGE